MEVNEISESSNFLQYMDPIYGHLSRVTSKLDKSNRLTQAVNAY